MNELSTSKRSYAIVSLVFITLILLLEGLVWGYWQAVVEAHLYKQAEGQAKFLGQALIQAKSIELERILSPGKNREQQHQLIGILFDDLLLVKAPNSGRELLSGIQFSASPDIAADFKLVRGETGCTHCFTVENIALVSPENLTLIGSSTLWIDDSFYRVLSHDLRVKLIAMSLLGAALLGCVWLLVILLFRRLHHVKEQVEAAGYAKTRFLANVSHELRTPLNAILGYTQLFKQDGQLMRGYGQAVDTIHRSGEHLLNLINDVLDFAKTESTHLKLTEEDFDFPDFLQSLAEMTRIRAQLKDIHFVYNIPVELPRRVRADHKRLRQVLLNLLSNAVKFTDAGQVEFTVENLGRQESFDKLHFSIKDTGCGIPASARERIFLPFQQIAGNKNNTEGTGLGLTISRQLLELMGSRLEMRSQVGVGSEFYFSLNLASAVEECLPPSAECLVQAYTGPVRTLLIVDDNPFNRLVLKGLLKRIQFQTKECDNGMNCLQFLQDHPLPDLVLMDLLMPDMDGFEATRRIRGNPAWKNLPIIAISAAVGPDIEKRALSNGCNAFLSKPVNLPAILECLKRYLELEWIYQDKNQALAPKKPPAERPFVERPEEAMMEKLREDSRRHDIISLRKHLAELEKDKRYKTFTDKIAPLARQYQFKKIRNLLD